MAGTKVTPIIETAANTILEEIPNPGGERGRETWLLLPCHSGWLRGIPWSSSGLPFCDRTQEPSSGFLMGREAEFSSCKVIFRTVFHNVQGIRCMTTRDVTCQFSSRSLSFLHTMFSVRLALFPQVCLWGHWGQINYDRSMADMLQSQDLNPGLPDSKAHIPPQSHFYCPVHEDQILDCQSLNGLQQWFSPTHNLAQHTTDQ